jgi:hypothetical protein
VKRLGVLFDLFDFCEQAFGADSFISTQFLGKRRLLRVELVTAGRLHRLGRDSQN